MEIAYPGDEIAIIEEYLPGENTYVDSNGVVRASIIGRVVKDNNQHIIQVRPLRKLSLLNINDIVYGRVVSIPNDKVAIIKIFAVLYNDEIKVLKNTFSGLLHISQASDTFINNIVEVLGIGDTVKAKVISKGPPYLLSIKGLSLGVIQAQCPVCNSVLKRRGQSFQCMNCGTIVKRKVPLVD